MIKCLICNEFESNNLTMHLKKVHNMSTHEYKKQFNVKYVTSDFFRNQVKKNVSSCWKIDYWIKKGFTEDEAKVKISEIQSNNSKKGLDENGNKIDQSGSCFKPEFWIKHHNYTEQEAIDKIKEQQSIRSKKASKFKGHNHTIESKHNISLNMSKHIKTIGGDIWAKHFNSCGTISKGELELYMFICDNFKIDLQAQHVIDKYYVDMIYENKVIEYNGDYWHCNPKMYNENMILNFPGRPNTNVIDIWKQDEERLNIIKSLGYDVLVIWENDWQKNKEYVINLLNKYLCK